MTLNRSVDSVCRSHLANALQRGKLNDADVAECLKSHDPVVLLELYEQLKSCDVSQFQVNERDYTEFLLRYFSFAISNCCKKIDVRYPDRFEAAEDCAAWFRLLWSQRPTSDCALLKLKNTLSSLCLLQDELSREAVLLGILEHVIALPGVKTYFADWYLEPSLAKIIGEAEELSPD